MDDGGALELKSGWDLCLREIATSRVAGTVPIRSQCSGWVVRGWVLAPVGCFYDSHAYVVATNH